MRLPLLTLLLGLLIGIATHSFVTGQFQKIVSALTVKTPAPKPTVVSILRPTKPYTPMPVEKILAWLKKDFDAAVVVVIANHSYDDRHKLARVEVLEVWKGPADLIGKTMDAPLSPPLSANHGGGTMRVLKFMPMTPHLTTSGTVRLEGEALGLNPAVTLKVLKDAFQITDRSVVH